MPHEKLSRQFQAHLQDFSAEETKTTKGHILNTALDVCSNQRAKHEMGDTDFKWGAAIPLSRHSEPSDHALHRAVYRYFRTVYFKRKQMRCYLFQRTSFTHIVPSSCLTSSIGLLVSYLRRIFSETKTYCLYCCCPAIMQPRSLQKLLKWS